MKFLMMRFVGLDACRIFSHFLFDHNLAIGFPKGVGEHGGTSRFQVVALASGRVHHLIPHAALLVLPFQNGIEVFLQQIDQLPRRV